MENPYKILEIQENASKEEITQAFRRLARKWHPDRNKSPEATEMFKKINDAHDYLIDDNKRKFLNKTGRRMDDEDEARQSAQDGFPFGPGGPFGAGFPFGPGGPFGGGGFPFGPGVHFTQFQAGPNPEQIKEMKKRQLHIKMNIELTLEQIYTGIKRTIKYPRIRAANGVQKQEEGLLELNIKPGVHTNSQIEIKDKGHIIIEDNGSELIGSIIITISESANQIYERDSKRPENLICKKTLTFIEALCGFSLELPHPSGKTLFFEYNDIISQNLTYKINNKGLPIHDQGKMYGDIIFKFEIVYPSEISEKQKENMSKIFNYNIKECSKDIANVILGSLIVYEENETNDNNDDDNMHNGMNGQTVQCAQS
jgi:DnaJ-class molecular chaperone